MTAHPAHRSGRGRQVARLLAVLGVGIVVVAGVVGPAVAQQDADPVVAERVTIAPAATTAHVGSDVTVTVTVEDVRESGAASPSEGATPAVLLDGHGSPVDHVLTVTPVDAEVAVTDVHAVTVAVTRDDGAGIAPADGVPIAVTLVGAGSVAAVDAAWLGTDATAATCVTPATGSCLVELASDEVGDLVVEVTASPEIDGTTRTMTGAAVVRWIAAGPDEEEPGIGELIDPAEEERSGELADPAEEESPDPVEVLGVAQETDERAAAADRTASPPTATAAATVARTLPATGTRATGAAISAAILFGSGAALLAVGGRAASTRVREHATGISGADGRTRD